MKTIHLNQKYMEVVRQMNPKKSDSELIVASHEFAEAYCQNHPDFDLVRQLFWEKVSKGKLIWNCTLFQFSEGLWVRMDDKYNSAVPCFCHFGESESAASSIMESVDIKTIQQAFAYILSKVY